MPLIKKGEVIPEHIRRLMPKEDRREMGKAASTMPEIAEEQGRKLEKKIQEEICQYLNLYGITYFRQRMDRKTTGTVGWPDFSFVINGQACFMEVKRPGGKPDPDQERVLAALSKAGAHIAVVTSLLEAIEFIQARYAQA